MSVRVRFAPSPTGHLHVGGARTALYNYLYARVHGGTFVLRIEDTDAARSTEASTAAIFDSLRWLGLPWDEGPGAGGEHGPYVQTERRDHYRRQADALERRGGAYRCWCTPEELEARRAAQLERGESPRYDGRCRALDAAGHAAREAEGRVGALRFALAPDGVTAWDDVVRGPIEFRNDQLEDFVVMRSDGLPTYNFACVVDDHEMAISHVIRGDDHISNTPRQLVLYRAFGWEPPAFAHVSMILGADGSRLSKRHGATSVGTWRDLGYVPEALVNFLVLLGWSYDGQRELFDLRELETLFRLERVGSNPAVFDTAKLEWMNAQHLKRLPEVERAARVRAFLAERGHDVASRTEAWWIAFVRALGDRLKTLADAARVGAFALEDALEVEAAAWEDLNGRADAGVRLEMLAVRLDAADAFTLESTEAATRALAAELAIKPGELMAMARVALTGRTSSPGLFEVMTLLGRERTLERLRAAAVRWHAERAGAGR